MWRKSQKPGSLWVLRLETPVLINLEDRNVLNVRLRDRSKRPLKLEKINSF